MDTQNYSNYNNWDQAYQGSFTGANIQGGFIGGNTIGISGGISGYIQQYGEREKYCPRDGHSFNCGDNYCSRCGRPIGYLSQGYHPYVPLYGTTWGLQAANQQFVAYNQAAQEAIKDKNESK